MITSIWFDFFV